MLICSTSKWQPQLKEIMDILSTSFNSGIKLADLEIKKFADGELLPVFKDTVRDQNLLIIGSTEQPHDNIFELILIIDAARRSCVNKITLLIPYFGYARQDRRGGERCSHGSKTVSNILENAGADHIITFDVHALQIDGNFNIPFDNITIDRVLGHSIAQRIKEISAPIILCSPDAGGVKRVTLINHFLDDKYPIVTILKTRTEANKVDSMQLMGDVKGKFVVIADDILDTAGTLCKAAEYLMSEGAVGVGAAITHGILSNDACQKIADSKLSFLIMSTSITTVREKIEKIMELQYANKEAGGNNTVTQLGVANSNGLIANIITRIDRSVSLSEKVSVN